MSNSHRLCCRQRALQTYSQALLEVFDRHLWRLVGILFSTHDMPAFDVLLGSYMILFVLAIPVTTFQAKHSRYPQVTFPNGVFSGTIIASVIPNGDLKSTAEWQLLLGAIALPGVFVGAKLCNPFGRRNTVSFHVHVDARRRSHEGHGLQMMLGFAGYLVFGLIIGCAYERITKASSSHLS